jgi:hypothetical protein
VDALDGEPEPIAPPRGAGEQVIGLERGEPGGIARVRSVPLRVRTNPLARPASMASRAPRSRAVTASRNSASE